MAKLNTIKRSNEFTHEGARAKLINPEQQLRRSVMACLLWENTFYEDGESIAERISNLIPLIKAERVEEIAIEAREQFKLRHIPLLLLRVLAKRGNLHANTLTRVIQRPDEITEFLAIYWKDGKEPLSAQVKKGLSGAFNKFSEYQMSKYDRDGIVKLRDALFLSHAKPENKEKEILFKKIVDKTLETPDTWEVELSSGKDKRQTWERLLAENKLGALALLRNLRNMKNVDTDENLIKTALLNIRVDRVLPFRFITAARYASNLEPELEQAMLKCLNDHDKLSGHTVLLVDVSGSMNNAISSKSELTRIDAACGLAILLRGICEKVDVYTFSDSLVNIPARHGFALRDAIVNSQSHHGTPLGLAVKSIYADKSFHETGNIYGSHYRNVRDYQGQNLQPDRLIVITDEQSRDKVSDPIGKGYMINVSTNKNGVGYGAWNHVDGWSESIINWMIEYEKTKM